MPPPHSRSSPSVLFATPECAPLAKTGGLGDVSAALPPALAEAGLDVRVLLPGYRGVLESDPAAAELARLEVLGCPLRLLSSRLPTGIPLVIVDCPELYVRGGGPYQADDGEDWEDNALRFGVLSRVAALLGTKRSPLSWKPDVVHCNDWPTALGPVYLAFEPKPPAASVITIHNLAFQGIFPWSDLEGLEVPDAARGGEGLEYHKRASLLKGGLVYADAITTVSPTYARQIQGPDLGFGLDSVLRARRGALHGVLNGIDVATWNPQSDPHLAATYGILTLERKVANKRALKRRLGLAGPDDVPLLGTVSRITDQKGIDVIIAALPELVKHAQVAVVGTGDRAMVEQLRAAQLRHPERLAVAIAFDEALAHLVEAGADAFLMPSRFEPCGMNQMYSQRYGTPPVATATGGLVDTIVDDVDNAPDASGFLIPEATDEALVHGVKRMLAAYAKPAHWRMLQLNGMRRDFGWGPAALAYRDIYRRLRSSA